jgi:hypothetical protein
MICSGVIVKLSFDDASEAALFSGISLIFSSEGLGKLIILLIVFVLEALQELVFDKEELISFFNFNSKLGKATLIYSL